MRKPYFALRLRELATQAGIPLARLAQETGLTLDALHKIASGRRRPLITTALRIANVLGVEVEDLVVRKDVQIRRVAKR